jgi:hypothetical protein
VPVLRTGSSYGSFLDRLWELLQVHHSLYIVTTFTSQPLLINSGC